MRISVNTWVEGRPSAIRVKPPFNVAIFNPPLSLISRIASNRLGRRTESSYERFPHVTPVAKTGFPGNDVQCIATSFDHEPRGLESQRFNGLRRGFAGLLGEDPAELARAQVRGFSQFVHRQLAVQIFARVVQRVLYPV